MWGSGQMIKAMKYGKGPRRGPLSMGPERPCYATVSSCVLNMFVDLASTIWAGSMFHSLITLMEKKFLLQFRPFFKAGFS